MMVLNLQAVALAIVGTGGAWMVGSALFNTGARTLNSVQRRGLLLSGIGFIGCAASARWLQNSGTIGVACSLSGTALAISGLYQLLRERAERVSPRETDSRE
ncbi:MAG: hypothetical protein M3Y64_02995 [Gemmatimonadota bacterium]|nr:hypothetical protein [Gemmatimonadota bacterium]